MDFLYYKTVFSALFIRTGFVFTFYLKRVSWEIFEM